jgi:hypothetical protein
VFFDVTNIRWLLQTSIPLAEISIERFWSVRVGSERD